MSLNRQLSDTFLVFYRKLFHFEQSSFVPVKLWTPFNRGVNRHKQVHFSLISKIFLVFGDFQLKKTKNIQNFLCERTDDSNLIFVSVKKCRLTAC